MGKKALRIILYGTHNRLRFLILYLIPALCWAPTIPSDPLKDHYCNTKKLWAIYIHNSTPKELMDFTLNTYQGTNKRPELYKALSVISVLETNNDKRLQKKYAFLGGHKATVAKGRKEIGWKAPETMALAYRFKTIYDSWHPPMLPPLERTVKVWNKGPNGLSKAQGYWDNFQKIGRHYDIFR